MPYDHDGVVASITEFYTFLTTHLHFQPSELKTPPPTGWPEINPSRFAFLGKTDKVIDLLKHLPYLPAGDLNMKHIYDNTICADYTDEENDEDINRGVGRRDMFEPLEDWVADCPWEQLRERHEHVVVLGKPERADNGCFIFLDTTDGEVAVWNVMFDHYDSFGNAGEFTTSLRESFENLEIFPTPNAVERMRKDDPLKDIAMSFGWPPSHGDEGGWRREECFKAVEKEMEREMEGSPAEEA